MQNVPLKITHIASGDLWAGAEVQLFTLCDSLKNDFDIHVEVVLLNGGELETRLNEIGIKVHILDERKLNALTITKNIIRILKATKPDVVHTHRFKENIIGGFAAFIAGKIPSIRTCHGHSEFYPSLFQINKRCLHVIEKIVGEHLQKRIVSVSPQLTESLSSLYSSKKIVVIENGVNLKAIKPFVKTPNIIPPRNVNVNYKIGFVGRLVNVKRIDKYIEFADHWHRNNQIPCDFLIYGDGPLEQTLKEQAANTCCSENIIFYGHTKDIYSAISALDVLVLISDHEGLPMTLIESMAIGTPILSVATGGIPKALGNGECGTLVVNQLAESFTFKLNQLLTNYEDTNQKSLKAQKRIAEYFSAKCNAKRFIDLYRSIQVSNE